jgi:hypothetical protein
MITVNNNRITTCTFSRLPINEPIITDKNEAIPKMILSGSKFKIKTSL